MSGSSRSRNKVDVAAGRAIDVDATLQVQSESQTVLVTAPRLTGEVEAINIERTADNIVQVLPSEVIRSLPNANMADALGRLPSITLERDEGEGKYVQVRGTEPRLTNTTIDGVNLPSPEPGSGKSSSTPFQPISWSGSRSTRRSWQTWTGTVSVDP